MSNEHDVHVVIDGREYAFNPHKMLYGIGSGRIRASSGESAERTAAAILLDAIEQGAFGFAFAGATVDELIGSAAHLVASGLLQECSVRLPPEFN